MVAVELIRDIFENRIDYRINVNDTELLPDDKVKIYLCHTLTLRPLSVLMFNNIEFKVEFASNNEWVIVFPDANGNAFDGDYVIAPKPLFMHGSPNSVNIEYLQISSDTRDKTPFSWLLRGLRIRKPKEKNSIIDYTVSGRLFLMDEADSSSWTNDAHDFNAVNPMENLAYAFEETVDKMPGINFSSNFEIIDRARFGVNVENKGSVKKIISDDLSGVELIYSIDVYKSNCTC